MKLHIRGPNGDHTCRYLRAFHTEEYLDASKAPGVVRFLGSPIQEDGTFRWPFPNLREILIKDASCSSAGEILAMVRSRKGRLSPTSPARAELPVSLRVLTIGKGCPMDKVTFLELQAILPEAEVVWQGENAAN